MTPPIMKKLTHTAVSSVLQVPTTQLAKMSIDPKFVELTADVLEIFLQSKAKQNKRQVLHKKIEIGFSHRLTFLFWARGKAHFLMLHFFLQGVFPTNSSTAHIHAVSARTMTFFLSLTCTRCISRVSQRPPPSQQ